MVADAFHPGPRADWERVGCQRSGGEEAADLGATVKYRFAARTVSQASARSRAMLRMLMSAAIVVIGFVLLGLRTHSGLPANSEHRWFGCAGSRVS